MGQVLVQDTLPDLVIASTTTITMATTYLGKQTRISVGGQQYLYSSVITINFATTGINGLDTGAIAANSLYYIYSVQTSNTPGLVASLAAPTTGPTGFTAWKEVGRCRTLSSASTLAVITNRVGGASSLSLGASDLQSYTPTANGFDASAVYQGFWRRVGASMQITALGRFAGAGTGTLVLGYPTGYTINESKLTGAATDRSLIGTVQFYDASATSVFTGSATHILTVAGPRFYGATNILLWTTGNPVTAAAGDIVTMDVTIPIVEFAGLYT